MCKPVTFPGMTGHLRRNTQRYYDPLYEHFNDCQEISKTHEAISKVKTERERECSSVPFRELTSVS
jgi:hypothetical protein